MTLKFRKSPLLQIVMYKSKKPATEKLQIFTNSLIQLKIPEAISEYSYLIQWLTQPNEQMATKCIFSRYDTRKPTRQAYFQCTPLDLGCNIKGRIIRKDKQRHEIIYENDFGQVAVQNQIKAKLWISPPFEVKIVLNKTMLIKGSINLKLNQNKNNLQKVLAINLSSSQFQFQIKIDENIRLPSNNAFFKFYKGEPQSLGLSIYHQHAEFMDKVKRITNVQATEFYLKLIFESRAQRDIFLFKIMENFRIFANQDALKANQYQRVENRRSIQSIPQKKSNSKIKQLDDQILKLLCDASDVKNQLSLDLIQAENLLSSCKQIQLLNKSILDQSFENLEAQKQQREPNKLIKNRQQQINNNDKSYSKSKSNSITVTNNLKSNENIEYKREINKLTNEIKLLIEENKRLNRQNKRLKEENMKLRLKDIKNSSITRKSDDKSLSQKNKDRSHSKSPVGYHKRKASILPPKENQSKNNQICHKKSFRQTIWKGNIKDYAKESCRRQNKGQLAASTGSVLFGGVKITPQEIKQKNNKHYMSTASTKDLGIQDKSFIAHGSNGLNLCKSEERLKKLLPYSSQSNCIVAESCELFQKNMMSMNNKFTSSSSLSKLRNTNSPLASSISIRLQKMK